MGLATEIRRLQGAKADLETAIESKGVTVPPGTLIDAYPALVDDIQRDVYDGIIVKTRDSNGYALTVDFYGTEVKKEQFYAAGSGTGGFCKMTDIDFKNDVTTIYSSAFYSCAALALTSLPASVATVSGGAFKVCTSLAITSMPGVTRLDNEAFRGCTNLQTVSMPVMQNLSYSSVFYGCTGLTSVTVGSIGYPVRPPIHVSTFSGCTQVGLTITIYVTPGTQPLANSPWGATNATIIYKSAVTGEVL